MWITSKPNFTLHCDKAMIKRTFTHLIKESLIFKIVLNLHSPPPWILWAYLEPVLSKEYCLWNKTTTSRPVFPLLLQTKKRFNRSLQIDKSPKWSFTRPLFAFSNNTIQEAMTKEFSNNIVDINPRFNFFTKRVLSVKFFIPLCDLIKQSKIRQAQTI